MLRIVTDPVVWTVCQYVTVILISPAKTAELIEIPGKGLPIVKYRYYCLCAAAMRSFYGRPM